MDLFLLVGQSNMAGRGKLPPHHKDTTNNPTIVNGIEILFLNSDHCWKPARDPLHSDKSTAGVGPGLQFAAEIARMGLIANDRKIGLIPCAVGGSAISEWNPPSQPKPLHQSHSQSPTGVSSDLLKSIPESTVSSTDIPPPSDLKLDPPSATMIGIASAPKYQYLAPDAGYELESHSETETEPETEPESKSTTIPPSKRSKSKSNPKRRQRKPNYFDKSVETTQMAMKCARDIIPQSATIELKGILWHQGESDSGDMKLARLYSDRITRVITAFRECFDDPNIPVLVGGLGDFLGRRKDDNFLYFTNINHSLHSLERRLHRTMFVSSEGLSDKGDLLHFDTPSAETLGVRYARTYAVTCGAVHLSNNGEFRKAVALKDKAWDKTKRMGWKEWVGLFGLCVVAYISWREYRRRAFLFTVKTSSNDK